MDSRILVRAARYYSYQYINTTLVVGESSYATWSDLVSDGHKDVSARCQLLFISRHEYCCTAYQVYSFLCGFEHACTSLKVLCQTNCDGCYIGHVRVRIRLLWWYDRRNALGAHPVVLLTSATSEIRPFERANLFLHGGMLSCLTTNVVLSAAGGTEEGGGIRSCHQVLVRYLV